MLFIFAALAFANAQIAGPDGTYIDGSRRDDTQIRTCWINPDADRWVDGESSMAAVEAAVSREYARAGITVYGWRPCTFRDQAPEVVRILIEDGHPQVAKFGCRGLSGEAWCVRLNFTFKEWPAPGDSCSTKNWNTYWACNCTVQSKVKNCIANYSLHEFGHVLGLGHEADHEQSTCSDRTGSDLIGITPYDPLSIMNYCRNKEQIELNLVPALSVGDLATIQAIYFPSTSM